MSLSIPLVTIQSAKKTSYYTHFAPHSRNSYKDAIMLAKQPNKYGHHWIDQCCQESGILCRVDQHTVKTATILIYIEEAYQRLIRQSNPISLLQDAMKTFFLEIESLCIIESSHVLLIVPDDITPVVEYLFDARVDLSRHTRGAWQYDMHDPQAVHTWLHTTGCTRAKHIYQALAICINP